MTKPPVYDQGRKEGLGVSPHIESVSRSDTEIPRHSSFTTNREDSLKVFWWVILAPSTLFFQKGEYYRCEVKEVVSLTRTHGDGLLCRCVQKKKKFFCYTLSFYRSVPRSNRSPMRSGVIREPRTFVSKFNSSKVRTEVSWGNPSLFSVFLGTVRWSWRGLFEIYIEEFPRVLKLCICKNLLDPIRIGKFLLLYLRFS